MSTPKNPTYPKLSIRQGSDGWFSHCGLLKLSQGHRRQQDGTQTPGFSMPSSKALENRVNFGSGQQESGFAFSRTPSRISSPTSQKPHGKETHSQHQTATGAPSIYWKTSAKRPPCQLLVGTTSITGHFPRSRALPQEPSTSRTPHSSRLPRTPAPRPLGFCISYGGKEGPSTPRRPQLCAHAGGLPGAA